MEKVTTKGLQDPMKNLASGNNHALQSLDVDKQVGKKSWGGIVSPMGKSKVQKSSPMKSIEPKFITSRLDYVKNKRPSNSLSKLAFSNALIQNANEETINIPIKMFNNLFIEAIKTSTVPTDLLKILFREGKDSSSYIVIVDNVPKEMKT